MEPVEPVEPTPGLRVKPVEGVDAGAHACHEKAEKILGRIKKKNFWSEREIKLPMVHRALQLWWAAATTKSGAASSALASRGLDPSVACMSLENVDRCGTDVRRVAGGKVSVWMPAA